MRRAALAIAFCLAGCATPPKRPIDVADDAFAHGDTRAAEASYGQAQKAAASPDEQFRSRFFAVLSRRASGGPEQFDATLADLRQLAAEATGTRWGRLAALYADEMSHTDALRLALQRAGADLAKLQGQIAALQAEIAQGQKANADVTAQLEETQDERNALQRNVQALEQQLADRNAAFTELSGELQALKQIDLSRGP